MRQFFAVAVGMLAASSAPGQVFECVDAQGSKEYAQFCAPETVRQIQIQQGGKAGAAVTESSATPAAGSTSEQDVAFRKRALEKQEADAKAEREKTEADVNRRNCELARNELKLLQSGQRMTKTDPDSGERIFIDDKLRNAEIVNVQESVGIWCKR